MEAQKSGDVRHHKVEMDSSPFIYIWESFVRMVHSDP